MALITAICRPSTSSSTWSAKLSPFVSYTVALSPLLTGLPSLSNFLRWIEPPRGAGPAPAAGSRSVADRPATTRSATASAFCS
jgi:hypothetical protein